jgi:hypothetical protein
VEEHQVRDETKTGWLQRLFGFVGVLFLLSVLTLVPGRVWAQEDDPVSQGKPLSPRDVRVQILSSGLESERGDFFRVFDLEAGDTLYVRAMRTSGNLDPIVALADQDYDASLLREAFWGQIELVTEQGDDPLEALPEIYNSLFVAWDDDSGRGYQPEMVFEVEEEGIYQILVTGSPTSLEPTFGDYRLFVGKNAPEVLESAPGEVGEPFVVHDLESSEHGQAVQVIEGELTEEESVAIYTLDVLNEGDLLTVYADSPGGAFKPVLLLEDFGEKLIASDNLAGLSDTALLSHRFLREAEQHKLRVYGYSGGEPRPTGSYRLVVTVNAPKEAVPQAFNRGRKLIREPIEVGIGITLQQITDVDQVSENFGAVAELTMKWVDPKLAFSPDSCKCLSEVYTGDSFTKYAENAGLDWPQFTFFNQQGNRWTQNRNVVVNNDGTTAYHERFTTDFQAPDFNFRQFPFDSQTLYMRVHSLYPGDVFTYAADEELSGIGDQLGEEEWFVVEAATEITAGENDRSEYALRFVVKRYLQFYIFRIFVPIILIIIVSWFSFFLKDYGKRVDVAGANLLVFVAFNFTVSGELPRLGYLTFMDAVLIGVFVISAIVVVFNVYLKRLEMAGNSERAERIDRFSIWIYPLAYGIGAIIAYILFFGLG